MKNKQPENVTQKTALLSIGFVVVSVFYLLVPESALLAHPGRGHLRATQCGWMPDMCAPTDRLPQPNLTVLPHNVDGTWTDDGPPVNVPFTNEFGEREVRVTDGNVPGGYPDGIGWRGPVTPANNYFSVYDSSIGGYYVYVPLDGGGNRLFVLKPNTMHVTPVCRPAWSGCNPPYADEWSHVTPGLMYYVNGTAVYKYNYDTNAGPTKIYDFTNCPGLVANESAGSSVNNGFVNYNDKIFTVTIGRGILAEYNTSNNKCYWFSTVYGLAGGTDNPTPIPSTLPWPSPPTLGTLGTTSGSLPPGTYYLEETLRTDLNYSPSETLPSNEGTVTLSSTGGITIGPETNVPSDILRVVGKYCNIYVGTQSGGEMLQLSNQNCSSTVTLAGPLQSGALPPVKNAAGFWPHTLGSNLSGQYGWLTPDQLATYSNFIWQVFDSSGVETARTLVTGVTGHTAYGNGQLFYVINAPPAGGVPAHYDFGLTPANNPVGGKGNFIRLHPQGPPMFNPYNNDNECNVNDTHPNWNYDNATDRMPIVVSSFVDGPTAYPLMKIQCAWDHEIDAVASNGSGTTWRLAHNRASGLANPRSQPDSSYNALSMPVCSSDGHYCMWSTDWQSALGTQTYNTTIGGVACVGSCKWNSGANYEHLREIIDSNGNEEAAIVAGRSGATQPAWPTVANQTVKDGTVTWQMQPGCNTSATLPVPTQGNPQGKGLCRTDVFIVEAK
jgi:hypothetical protein